MTAPDGLDPDDIVIELMSEPQPQDPYPMYHALRTAAPNHPSILGMRFVSSHHGCLELLRSSAFTQGFGMAFEGFEDRPFIKMTSEILVFTDPPQHTRLRRLVSMAFLPRTVEALVPRVQAFADEVLDRIAESGKADLVVDYAMPIPAMVLTEMLGAPFEEHRMVQQWVDAVGNALKPVLDEETLQRADVAAVEFDAYIRRLVAERRARPGDDLLSGLIAAEEEGDRLTENELVNLLFTIMAAGSETTASLISSGLLLLLQHPAERGRLLDEPDLILNAVDEMLRYETPIQNSFMRVATEDTEVDGEPVVEHEQVVALLGAANRDPAVFADPDRFAIDRPEANEHIAFGFGAHFCLGRAVGRQTGAVAIGSLVRRFPEMQLLDDHPTWRKTLPTRRLDRLDVTTGP